jgi:phospholipase A1/A2
MYLWLILQIFLLQIPVDNSSLKKGNQFFNTNQYKKAHEIYLKIVMEKKSAAIASKLGWMYENGKGVKKDKAKAFHWYKIAAKFQLYSSKKNKVKFLETMYSNLTPQEGKFTKTLMQYISGSFGLRAYHPNYLIFSYSDPIPRGDPLLQDSLYKNIETKYQISLRADYQTKWLGFTQMWSAAYTQTSFWQIFTESAPFRETNYMPELFISIPFFRSLDMLYLKGISMGYLHASNGQPKGESDIRIRPDGPFEDSRSRSWNQLYLRLFFQRNNIFAQTTLWYRIPEISKELDDNPDILHYYGFASLKISYLFHELVSSIKLRQHFRTGKGAVEMDISYPVPLGNKAFFYLQLFSGYGQSLIDYDHYTNQIGFGLSISR